MFEGYCLYVASSDAQEIFENLEFFMIQEDSGWLDETFQVFCFCRVEFWIGVQVSDLVQVSADQVHIVHIFHWQIFEQSKPNFLRQFRPARWGLKFITIKLVFLVVFFHDSPLMTWLLFLSDELFEQQYWKNIQNFS